MRDTAGERELIGRMQAGDMSAVADLSTTYGARIHQLAFRYMKNWEDAEEVTQDVLMKVFRKIDAFRGDAALSSWIYRIAVNLCKNRVKYLKRRHSEAQDEYALVSQQRTAAAQAEGLADSQTNVEQHGEQ